MRYKDRIKIRRKRREEEVEEERERGERGQEEAKREDIYRKV